MVKGRPWYYPKQCFSKKYLYIWSASTHTAHLLCWLDEFETRHALGVTFRYNFFYVDSIWHQFSLSDFVNSHDWPCTNYCGLRYWQFWLKWYRLTVCCYDPLMIAKYQTLFLCEVCHIYIVTLSSLMLASLPIGRYIPTVMTNTSLNLGLNIYDASQEMVIWRS